MLSNIPRQSPLIVVAAIALIGSTPLLALAAPPGLPPQPPASAAPAPAVVEPLPGAKEAASTAPPAATALPVPTSESAVTGEPAATGTAAIDATAPPPAAPVPSAPVPAAPTSSVDLGDGARRADTPIFERWWFWTAIGAVAITSVVIVATSSGPSAPRTELGNMTAF